MGVRIGPEEGFWGRGRGGNGGEGGKGGGSAGKWERTIFQPTGQTALGCFWPWKWKGL